MTTPKFGHEELQTYELPEITDSSRKKEIWLERFLRKTYWIVHWTYLMRFIICILLCLYLYQTQEIHYILFNFFLIHCYFLSCIYIIPYTCFPKNRIIRTILEPVLICVVFHLLCTHFGQRNYKMTLATSSNEELYVEKAYVDRSFNENDRKKWIGFFAAVFMGASSFDIFYLVVLLFFKYIVDKLEGGGKKRKDYVEVMKLILFPFYSPMKKSIRDIPMEEIRRDASSAIAPILTKC